MRAILGWGLTLLAGALLPSCATGPAGTDVVAVKDAGNPSHPLNRGRVAHAYSLGRHEVTNREYAEFLNSVDSTAHNRLGLWNTAMASSGGIARSSSQPEGQRYRLVPGRENDPVVLVSVFDAMRYCNWLHNGKFAQGTEIGAYNLDGQAIPRNRGSVVRQPTAKVFLPTENEWFKAAYFDPTRAGGYWRYPVRSDELNASSPPGGPNAANTAGGAGRLVPVGSYSEAQSAYGARDLAGNVAEWTETRAGSGRRIVRGGSWRTGAGAASDSGRQPVAETSDRADTGFRIAVRGAVGGGSVKPKAEPKPEPEEEPQVEAEAEAEGEAEERSAPAQPPAAQPVEEETPAPKPRKKRITTNLMG